MEQDNITVEGYIIGMGIKRNESAARVFSFIK